MKYLITLISFIFLLSCTKSGKNITLKGRVLNPVTGEGIADAEIWLQKTAGGYNGGWKTVKKTVSNGDGNFVLEKIGFAGYAAVTGVFPGEYYQLGWTQDQGATYAGNFRIWPKIGKTMHADYYAVPQGEYKVIFNNINCQGLSDSIIIRQSNVVNSFIDNEWILKGCDGYETSFSKTPMGTITTTCVVKRSGVVTSFTTYFDVIPNQENIQTINY